MNRDTSPETSESLEELEGAMAPGEAIAEIPSSHPPTVDQACPAVGEPFEECSPQNQDSPGEFQQVDPRYIIAERIAGGILTAILSLGAVVSFLVWGTTLFFTGASAMAWGILVACLFASAALLGVFGWILNHWPLLEHRHLSWRLNQVGLEIQRGVWWQHRISVPRDRVQHTDISQGPLLRRYSLAKLTIHTAGTHSPTIELPGVSMEVAQQLKGELTDAAKRSHSPASIR